MLQNIIRCLLQIVEGKFQQNLKNWSKITFLKFLFLIGQKSENPDDFSSGPLNMAPPAGLEPATYGLTVHRSTD